MKQPGLEHLRDVNGRRPLTAAEAAQVADWLAAAPDARAEWDQEAALNRALEFLPAAAPVSSNFTTLVMEQVALEEARRARETQPHKLGWLFRWLPRVALASVVVGGSLLGFRSLELRHRRVLAEDAAQIYEMVASSPEWFADFDAINAIGRSANPEPKADTELLALLQ